MRLTPLPMFHIGGIGWLLRALAGRRTVLVSDIDAEKVLDIIEQQRVTNAFLVPTVLGMLMRRDGAADRD